MCCGRDCCEPFYTVYMHNVLLVELFMLKHVLCSCIYNKMFGSNPTWSSAVHSRILLLLLCLFESMSIYVSYITVCMEAQNGHPLQNLTNSNANFHSIFPFVHLHSFCSSLPFQSVYICEHCTSDAIMQYIHAVHACSLGFAQASSVKLWCTHVATCIHAFWFTACI